MFNSKIKKITALVSIITAVILLFSCGPLPYSRLGGAQVSVLIPLFPPSLSGNQIKDKGISRDPNMDEYSQFLVVPEAASNYNGFIDGLMTRISNEISINSFNDTFYWTKIETAPYDYEHNTGSTIFRTNIDYTQFEYVDNYNVFGTRTVYAYARINIQDTYTHSMYLLANLGGGTAPYDASHYFMEIIDTNSKRFTKVLQLVEDPVNRSMYHFVAVTDKNNYI
jgi:hypothetical protein